jgi:hypothetical protein
MAMPTSTCTRAGASFTPSPIATIESAESSTRLEGVVAPRARIEGVVLRDVAPQGRSEAEIAGYRDALRMIHESAEHIPFHESSIQQIHQLLCRYLSIPGGRYKATSNDIVEKDSSGNIVREGYFETLEVSSVGWHEGRHDTRPWIDYFLAVLTAAYRELEERITAVREGGGGTKTEMIRAAVSRRRTPFQISDLERELPNVSREFIRAVLKDLREEGTLRLEGIGRGATYIPTSPSVRA